MTYEDGYALIGRRMAVINRGFRGRGKRDEKLPRGRYLAEGFPVLSAGQDSRYIEAGGFDDP